MDVLGDACLDESKNRKCTFAAREDAEGQQQFPEASSRAARRATQRSGDLGHENLIRSHDVNTIYA
jgi:hypothetical protein